MPDRPDRVLIRATSVLEVHDVAARSEHRSYVSGLFRRQSVFLDYNPKHYTHILRFSASQMRFSMADIAGLKPELTQSLASGCYY